VVIRNDQERGSCRSEKILLLWCVVCIFVIINQQMIIYFYGTPFAVIYIRLILNYFVLSDKKLMDLLLIA